MQSPSRIVTKPVSRTVALLSALSLAAAFGPGPVHAQDQGAGSQPQASEGMSDGVAKPFFNWSDNSITLLPYGWGFEVDPSEQSTVTFEHVHDSKIGDLFLFVDVIKFHGNAAGSPASTWYGELSPRLSLGKTLDKDMSSLGVVKDVLVAATYERGKDIGFDAPEAALLGVGFDLDTRDGGLLSGFRYVQLNVYGRAELTEGKRHGIRDAQVTMVAARPFTIGSTQFLIDGYFDWVLGIGSEDWHYHLNPQISVDAGNFWGKPGKLFVGTEVDFWWNKYEIPNSSAFDTNQSAASLMFKYHF